MAGRPSTRTEAARWPGRKWKRATHAREAPSSAASRANRTPPRPSVSMRRSVCTDVPRSKRLRRAAARRAASGKASRVSVDQSCSSTRKAGESASTRRPPRRCHMGCRSKGCFAEIHFGPETTVPSHASCQLPGGIQTCRLVTLKRKLKMGATSTSPRKTYCHFEALAGASSGHRRSHRAASGKPVSVAWCPAAMSDGSIL
mmetsp:Transcript_79764/g.247389  ORF Transcript_79764/g.247389 Transcript_79764/m.247389 type:complete len:201 (+) Transcript_79764:268-870(+)